MHPLKIANPFDGVTPDWGPFKDVLESPAQMFLGLIWIVAIFYVAGHFILAIASAVRANNAQRPQAKEDAVAKIVVNGLILACLALVPVLTGVFLAFAD